MIINERIKELRLSKRLTQKELAAAIDVSWRAIQNYEYGKQEPTLSVLMSISNFFEVSLDYLCGFNPYRIECRLDSSYSEKAISIKITNLSTNKSKTVDFFMEYNPLNNSLYLNCISDEAKQEYFKQVISELPTYCIKDINKQIEVIASDCFHIESEKGLLFSIKTDAYYV